VECFGLLDAGEMQRQLVIVYLEFGHVILRLFVETSRLAAMLPLSASSPLQRRWPTERVNSRDDNGGEQSLK
jgi:hypothetical protein